MAKLYALSDLHLGHDLNATAWAHLRPYPQGSGLILAGDIGETTAHLHTAFTKAKACFTHVFWVPGNHELYTLPSAHAGTTDALRGEAKYLAFVEIARAYGVLTPEDTWMMWRPPGPAGMAVPEGNEDAEEGAGQGVMVALCFTLYDYSFRPRHLTTKEKALDWAREQDIEATDETLLHADPYTSREAWCHALCDKWEQKFRQNVKLHPGVPFVLVNHWPLRESLVYIPRIPRFSLWCGTKRTEEWHERGKFGEEYAGAKVVVTGHLHVRRSDFVDGCRFEEVSLGYPRQWDAPRDQGKGVNELLREIVPGELMVAGQGTVWKKYG